MRQKIEMTVLVVALILVGITPRSLLAQVPLEDQLKAQYTMVKMGSDTSGTAVVDQGTTSSLRRAEFSVFPIPTRTSFPPSMKMERFILPTA